MKRLIPLVLLSTCAIAEDRGQMPDLETINQLFFHQYDGNGDGMVTRNEFLMPSVAQFEYLDRNGDGMVDMNEVSDFTRMMTQPPPQQ